MHHYVELLITWKPENTELAGLISDGEGMSIDEGPGSFILITEQKC